MGLEEFGKIVTAIGAVLAAVAGVWNLFLQLRGKRDNFMVRLGTVSPRIDEETILHVISLSDHTIKLTDWGFIETDGSFRSFQLDWETASLPEEGVRFQGSTELSGFGASYETGYQRIREPVGAYAISITQKRPRIYFAPDMPYWRRIWIRMRLLAQPQYLGW